MHVVRQGVPDGGSGDRESPAADGRQLHGRHQQTIGPSRAEGTSTRQTSAVDAFVLSGLSAELTS